MATLHDLETPTLLVDMDRLEANIASMAEVAKQHGKALRPHAKTHKCVEIARMQKAQGAVGLTVAKLGEAEVFADAGFNDLFVANEIFGEAKYARLLALLERATVAVGIDSVAVAAPLGEAAARKGVRIPVRVEVNTGHNRAGTRTIEETMEVGRFAEAHPGLTLTGLFTHEGHLYKTEPGEPRQMDAHEVAETMCALADAFARSGFHTEVVSVGSTPGAPLLALEPGITELRPGNYVFYDRSQVRIGANLEDCALTVLATVIGVHSDRRVILDAGMKSLASDCPFADKTFGEVLHKPGWTFVGASEEHGMIQLNHGGETPRVGDRVQIVPNHACTCVNMHDTMVVHRDSIIEAVWPVAARGRIQ
jgi:D-serine deaminase-like pyridoxal phosphate-dependent protein